MLSKEVKQEISNYYQGMSLDELMVCLDQEKDYYKEVKARSKFAIKILKDKIYGRQSH